MKSKVPNPLYFVFDKETLKNKQYLKDLDYIKTNLDTDYLLLSAREGVQFENYDQCNKVLKEFTEYAHTLDLKVGIHLLGIEGFFNAGVNAVEHPEIDQSQIFTINNPDRYAQGIVFEGEVQSDKEGYAIYHFKLKNWVRDKIRPLRNKLLKVYSFDKITEGFYKEDSLLDITEKSQIIDSRTNSMTLEIYGGKENAHRCYFVMVVQYYNAYELFGNSQWKSMKNIIDMYSDIPLDSIMMDEFGYMPLNSTEISSGKEEPFRGRFYSEYQAQYFQDKLGMDLARLLFDMRYVQEGKDSVRIRAINRYFDELRKPPLRHEHLVADYAQKIFGKNVFLTCHNTFHNNLDNDEIWKTSCNWWDLPRKYGHTDENIAYPVRMGIMLSARNPIHFDMFYSRESDAHYRHMIEGAPFCCREIHHAYNDRDWGLSFTEEEFVSNIKRLDEQISQLNVFQTEYPKMDLLVIYGSTAQNNWYPDESARNCWDINGKMKILDKCNEIWNAGYRCALVPDYAILDGRITMNNDKIIFCDYEFEHCVFMYPQYAKKEVHKFLDAAYKANISLAVIGDVNRDFDGDSVGLKIPVIEEFSLQIIKNLGCEKLSIPNGCIYTDGSFALVSYTGLMYGKPEEFDFRIGHVRYRGVNTGILAYRAGEVSVCTMGGVLYRDEEMISQSAL